MPGNVVNMDSHLARVALRRGVNVTEDCVGTERDHSLKQLNHFEMKKERIEKLILKKDAAMNAVLKVS